jgi:hypothetical protein
MGHIVAIADDCKVSKELKRYDVRVEGVAWTPRYEIMVEAIEQVPQHRH